MTMPRTILLTVALLTIATAVGCSGYRQSGSDGQYLEDDAAATLARMKAADPTLQRFLDSAAGYAVFPEVAKGAVGIGAAHGRGAVYEGGGVVGYAGLTQATIGLQLGGQVYSEVIFFETAADLGTFKRGEAEFAAQASAVAAAKGAAANADYANGVAVFTIGQKGLMFEASVGGQKFSYRPKADG